MRTKQQDQNADPVYEAWTEGWVEGWSKARHTNIQRKHIALAMQEAWDAWCEDNESLYSALSTPRPTEADAPSAWCEGWDAEMEHVVEKREVSEAAREITVDADREVQRRARDKRACRLTDLENLQLALDYEVGMFEYLVEEMKALLASEAKEATRHGHRGQHEQN